MVAQLACDLISTADHRSEEVRLRELAALRRWGEALAVAAALLGRTACGATAGFVLLLEQ